MSDQIGGAVSSITEQAATAQNQAEETAVASQDTERLVNNLNFITQFYTQVQGEFRSAMAEIEAKYAEASRAAQTYADNLVEMDNSTITY